MSKLVNIQANAVETIRDGLNDLGEAILQINSLIGDNDSAITVDGDGNIRTSNNFIFNNKVGIGVNNITEGVVLETNGAVKFQGKKFEVGNSIPSIGLYRQGDIVWHDTPVPNGNLGWICIRTGTPGEWRPFGNIGG